VILNNKKIGLPFFFFVRVLVRSLAGISPSKVHLVVESLSSSCRNFAVESAFCRILVVLSNPCRPVARPEDFVPFRQTPVAQNVYLKSMKK
jgi:hypothetical protein